MTGTAILLIILASAAKLLVSCLPTFVVEGLINKFEMHAKLSDENVIVTIDGKRLEDEDKIQVVNYFNEATVLKKYYIFPGNEQLFLQPENGGTPLVIDAKRGKKDVKLFVYSYKDHVDVVRQYKKKVIAYSVLSDSLQQRSMSVTGDLV
ncbi:YfmQ family protein [Domibacillus sp. A3M-37]|uniref:YfmQ family protein n=1 Tax=Domibacillus sp. A3M-37 TaxID=2962037 RepID=UPI0020B6511C|nr:YfmQ family protein [Domibacillus sp. A3M-37]MCP3764692.1 YfmQ family protein [Domibacillus sp. A3M-37]